jgi:hypothetical protein
VESTLIKWAVIIGIVFFILYCIVVAAFFIGLAMGTVGSAWGAGAAVVNYGKSVKVNLFDANRPGVSTAS